MLQAGNSFRRRLWTILSALGLIPAFLFGETGNGAIAQSEAALGRFEVLAVSATLTLSSIERLPPPGMSAMVQERFRLSCGKNFSIKSISSLRSPPRLHGTLSPIPGLVDGVRQFYECRAFVDRNHSLCDALKQFQHWDPYGDKIKTVDYQRDFAAYCSGLYKSFVNIQAGVMRKPDAVQICQSLPFSEEELAGFELEDECRWMVGDDPGPECSDPISPDIGESEIRECLLHHVLHADDRRCRLIEKAPVLSEGARATYRQRCWDAAAYRKAYEGRKIELCGESLVCRMLMGEDVCRRYLSPLKEVFCNEQSKEYVASRLEERRKAMDVLSRTLMEMRVLLGEMEGFLAQLERETGGGRRLRQRLRRALERVEFLEKQSARERHR